MFCKYISYKCFINIAVLSRKWNSKNMDIKDKIYKSHQKECWTDFCWGAVFMVEGLNGGRGPHIGCQLKFHYFVACQLKFPTFIGCW